ncbi:ABC transporter B family member 26, chloroplastic-like [Dorcoceras hygrometricum]|uniref:ABC transporter B family member 26, chloroplastic-like n=1 Tax=Dorcoceras hygrometricum TaxID=472368 RepID=A0A2Z7ACM4_9LAMI|nr:ABC transporter B family member 26, chloroplastic-like [Dorcoceras hygrometricum]
MANLPYMLQFSAQFKHNRNKSFPAIVPTTIFQSPDSVNVPTPSRTAFSLLDANLVNIPKKYLVSNAFKRGPEYCSGDTDESMRVLKRLLEFIRGVLPGGSWWRLADDEQETGSLSTLARPITALSALNQMWALINDEKGVLYTSFVALTIAALSEILMPGIITASVFSAANGETSMFYRKSLLLVFLCLTSGICSGLRSGCFAITNTILVKRLRETLFSSLLLQDMSFFDSEEVGELTSRISADCQRLSRTIGNDIHLILRNILQGSGAFVNLMILSWPLALSSLIICFTLSAVFVIYGQYQKKAAKLAQDFTSSANAVAQETLSSIRTVRAYGTETEECQRFAQGLDRLATVGMRESVAYGLWSMSFIMSYRMTQVFAVLLGGMSIFSSRFSAEQLTKYVLYCEWLIYAAWRIQDNMSSLLQSVGASEKVLQLMHLSPSSQFLSKGVKFQELTGCIEFADVSFHYSSRNTVPTLKRVNISIQSNEVVAIVGANGSGKSTLIKLMLRLYEPISGEIYVNGIPLKEMDIRCLREKIGFVGQDPHIFRGDVESNISYGCSRSIRREEIESAAKKVYAHDFISGLPHGYDTIIDDNLLSGGQKQRIAIARAILRDPEILVLDEATSSLDAESESYIKEVLHSLKKDSKKRTIIMISHRLSSVKVADRILVMDNGQIVEGSRGQAHCFYSKALVDRVLSKSTYENELMASTLAVRHWRPYLLGRKFVVLTDHKALKKLLHQKITTSDQQQWLSKLMGYEF